VSYELERIRKEEVEVYFEELSRHMYGGFEEGYETLVRISSLRAEI
jgi:hypothetical protein